MCATRRRLSLDVLPRNFRSRATAMPLPSPSASKIGFNAIAERGEWHPTDRVGWGVHRAADVEPHVCGGEFVDDVARRGPSGRADRGWSPRARNQTLGRLRERFAQCSRAVPAWCAG